MCLNDPAANALAPWGRPPRMVTPQGPNRAGTELFDTYPQGVLAIEFHLPPRQTCSVTPGGHLEILETIKCATSCCFNCLRDEGRSEDSSRSKYRVYELTFMFKLKVLDCGEAADSSNPQAQFMANAITITAQSVPICDPAADQRVRSAKYLYLWRCAWKTP